MSQSAVVPDVREEESGWLENEMMEERQRAEYVIEEECRLKKSGSVNHCETSLMRDSTVVAFMCCLMMTILALTCLHEAYVWCVCVRIIAPKDLDGLCEEDETQSINLSLISEVICKNGSTFVFLPRTSSLFEKVSTLIRANSCFQRCVSFFSFFVNASICHVVPGEILLRFFFARTIHSAIPT